MPTTADFTPLLAASRGDGHGAWSNLALMIYADLRRLARRAVTPDRDVDEVDAMERGKVENLVALVWARCRRHAIVGLGSKVLSDSCVRRTTRSSVAHGA